MIPLRKSGGRRHAAWLVAIVGIAGLVLVAAGLVRVRGEQTDLDERISSLQKDLSYWEYYRKRSQELEAKQALLRAKLGAQTTAATDGELAPCRAAAYVIPAVPPRHAWNPFRIRRSIRERRAWCRNAETVVAFARDCAAAGALLDHAIESLDSDLAQLASPRPR